MPKPKPNVSLKKIFLPCAAALSMAAVPFLGGCGGADQQPTPPKQDTPPIQQSTAPTPQNPQDKSYAQACADKTVKYTATQVVGTGILIALDCALFACIHTAATVAASVVLIPKVAVAGCAEGIVEKAMSPETSNPPASTVPPSEPASSSPPSSQAPEKSKGLTVSQYRNDWKPYGYTQMSFG